MSKSAKNAPHPITAKKNAPTQYYPNCTPKHMAPTFSNLRDRLNVSSDIHRFRTSAVSIVDLITPQDHLSIRLDFIRHVYTLLAYLFLFTAIAIAVCCLLFHVFNWIELLISLAATLVLCVTLSIFVYWTNFDFTVLFSLGYLLILGSIALVAFIIYGCIILPITTILFETVMTMACLLFLAITTQMTIGGGRAQEFPNERYIRAAMAMYIEILAIFFYIPITRLVKK